MDTATNIDDKVLEICRLAHSQKKNLLSLSPIAKQKLFENLRQELTKSSGDILLANEKDVMEAKLLVKAGEMSEALFNRLILTPDKIKKLADYVVSVSNLDDLVGIIDYKNKLDDDLILERRRYPLGVIGVIFESRPEVLVQVSALAIKSSNAAIIKGGSEAKHSNEMLFNIIQRVLIQHDLSNAIGLISSRDEVSSMLQQKQFIDLIIPRGSNEFVERIQRDSEIPVLGHSEGICHLYIDEFADPEKAKKISLDSKTDYPAACNAIETILFHKNCDYLIISILKEFSANNVRLHIDKELEQLCSENGIKVNSITDDWKREYCDMDLSVKLVSDIDEAIEHINQYGSGHTDSIVTESTENADNFLQSVDSASVFHNASTRFADGNVFGLGAEVGISTNKIHARGPVGLEGLLTTKYTLSGNGHVKNEYSGTGSKKFIHDRLV